ncbi:hypothetical protein OpiT1DRAFT_04131 [Opitutaceae bacterium TAV1]|nr:hypothetical protein OpiT1DRAFT_04131 [Opitutaceae bacterium TAV1]
MPATETHSIRENAHSVDPLLDWKRSDPDSIVYLPKGGDHADTDNEHFLVFESPSGNELLAMWTQSSVENFGNNHIMFARSPDGKTWSEPRIIAGARGSDDKGLQASWGFPVVTRKGRIYCFYLNETGRADIDRATTGTMGCIYSDDTGRTWISGGCVSMPRHPLDHPDPEMPKNWIVWQIPIRLASGAVLAGYTHWTSKHWQDNPPMGWYSRDSRCQFMRFENIDEHPPATQMRITWLPAGGKGLEVAFPGHPGLSVAQEPSVVQLPDGRIFCVMRTFTGYIWYAVSADEGATWTKPEILKSRDDGIPLKQPIASSPLYALRDGRYLLVYHNNDGHLGSWKPQHALHNRRPAFCAVGEFRPSARQPIWFGSPVLFADTDGIPIGPKGTSEIATYPSLTEWKGERMIWYPDRKYYLLGKRLTDDFLAGLRSGAA